MTYSSIAVSDLAVYLKIESEDLDDIQTAMLQAFLDAGRAYIESYTGQSAEYLDGCADVSIALLCVAGDMYTRRDMVTSLKGTGAASTNRTVQTILDKYVTNLIPEVLADV